MNGQSLLTSLMIFIVVLFVVLSTLVLLDLELLNLVVIATIVLVFAIILYFAAAAWPSIDHDPSSGHQRSRAASSKSWIKLLRRVWPPVAAAAVVATLIAFGMTIAGLSPFPS